MEPGDFISSIYLYVSLVLVSGNCIFNPLNRFNSLSTNFFQILFLVSHLLLLQYSCAARAPCQKTERQKGFWRSCGQGSASRIIPSSTSFFLFLLSLFLRRAVDNGIQEKCFNGIQYSWEPYSRE